MHFMLLFSETETDFARRSHPEQAEPYWGGWNAFIGAMAQAGVMVKGDGLQGPQVATTVRVRDGQRRVEDGPYADTKEQLGGYVVIDVADLETALDWAARAPCALTGAVERVSPTADPQQSAYRAAERAARQAYGRLLALLGRRTRDLAAAEDALAEAFASALRSWPVQGVPDNPDAWLFTAARRTLANVACHRQVIEAAADELRWLSTQAPDAPTPMPDERLSLLFVCAHPAIDASIHTALMLQTVLGLDAERIGAAFLVPGKTMGQRLVRAKAKIRDAGIRFERPDDHELPARLVPVLDAIYAAFGAGWDDAGVGDLAAEAIDLARVLVELLPREPEAQGLLALMLYCESRRPARRRDDGAFVPLAEQDPRRWRRELIIEAEQRLTTAARAGRFGRFQCEAAIQSVHVQRAVTGRLPAEALVSLYQLLSERAPSIGAAIGHAAALLQTGRPAAAQEQLDAIAPPSVAAHQPYWVVRAEVAAALDRRAEAEAAWQRALDLTRDPAVARYLGERRSRRSGVG